MKTALLRLIVASAVALASSCAKSPEHRRLYTNTNEIPAHAIEAERAFRPFGTPELRVVFEQTSSAAKDASKKVKENIQISPTFWYQNADSANGEVYTKLVFDFGPFDGYKEWNPFLDSIELKFHADWKRAPTSRSRNSSMLHPTEEKLRVRQYWGKSALGPAF